MAWASFGIALRFAAVVPLDVLSARASRLGRIRRCVVSVTCQQFQAEDGCIRVQMHLAPLVSVSAVYASLET
jgi:hypothetical protein